MKRKNRTAMSILLALVVLALAASAGPATITALSAETPVAGAGPEDAAAPVADWQPLASEESHWYAFQYKGDGSQIEVRLEVVPGEGATFAVWTPGQIRGWGRGERVEPVGRGSEDPRAEGSFIWSGSFPISGTYYVVVEHAGNQPGTSYYLLEISGAGVSFPAPGEAAASEPTPTPTPQPAKSQPRPETASGFAGKLVFQTTYGGNFYTINANGTNRQRITDGIDPVWSPDGQQIAFTRWREPRGVWVIDVDNADASGGERRVFDWSETRRPSWSPDAQQILFSRHHGGREDKEFCFGNRCFFIPGQPYWKLSTVNPNDGSFREPPGPYIALTPDWSPDGARIVYDDVHGLYIQSIQRDVVYQLTDHVRDTSPVWSPDGGQVAFVRSQHDHWEIYLVDADGGNLRRLTDTPERPDGIPGSSVSPAWSPDGNYLAFLTDRTGEWEIWVMKSNGSGQKPMFDDELDGLTLEYAYVAERAIDWTR